ncbi:GGDEF domain-containing protein [Pseudomonas sp. HLT2-19-2]
MLIALPYLVLWFLTRLTPEEVEAADQRNRFALIIDNIGPAVLTAVTICLAVIIGKSHPWLGFWVVIAVFAVSAIRSAFVQSRYILLQEELMTANRTLEHISYSDGLTGIANRRMFDIALQLSVELAKRHQTPLSLLLIDIDHFKNLNDTQGHLQGDKCLVRVAQALRGSVNRASDMAARYGGEEFVILLPHTSLSNALVIAQRSLETVKSLQIQNVTPTGEHLSISIGVATFDGKAIKTGAELVLAADTALYAAKRGGRATIRSNFA